MRGGWCSNMKQQTNPVPGLNSLKKKTRKEDRVSRMKSRYMKERLFWAASARSSQSQRCSAHCCDEPSILPELRRKTVQTSHSSKQGNQRVQRTVHCRNTSHVPIVAAAAESLNEEGCLILLWMVMEVASGNELMPNSIAWILNQFVRVTESALENIVLGKVNSVKPSSTSIMKEAQTVHGQQTNVREWRPVHNQVCEIRQAWWREVVNATR